MTVFRSTVIMMDSTMDTMIEVRHPMREIFIEGSLWNVTRPRLTVCEARPRGLPT